MSIAIQLYIIVIQPTIYINIHPQVIISRIYKLFFRRIYH